MEKRKYFNKTISIKSVYIRHSPGDLTRLKSDRAPDGDFGLESFLEEDGERFVEFGRDPTLIPFFDPLGET